MATLLAVALFLIALMPQPLGAEILDNSFFVEEAYNQEPRVVQHIQTFHWSREWEGDEADRAFSYSFTQEWPLVGQRHQLSYTIPYERVSGAQGRADGVGDVQIHYRNQLFAEVGGRPAFAPRITLILPTGDRDEGLGAGTTGFQVNLPLSKRLEAIHVHMNWGATFVPGAKVALPSGSNSAARDLFSTQFGFSVIALLSERLNLLLETVTGVDEEISPSSDIEKTSRVLLSPGARFAIDRKDGGQWVLGAAAPIGISEAQDDFGVFLYLSFEHHY